MLALNPHISISQIKEGFALFNRFTGDTYFLPASFDGLLLTLIKTPCASKELLALFLCHYQNDTKEKNVASEQFDQFITEAINSGIIVEK